jgi:1-deoxy-D-xylulose-5-phosphate reductoisomerase
MAKLEFSEPDQEKFPCLRLAYKALRTGGTASAVLNAANEVAVEAFLNNGIAFHEISQVIESVLDSHTPNGAADLQAVLRADAWAREEARILSKSNGSAASR